jgi:DNA-binding LacI/PurR family transcriptional regulator
MAEGLDLRGEQRPTTGVDVARLARVSQATVSLVLSGRAGSIGVSAATQERVISAAAELGYTPNRAAQSLRRRRTDTITFMTSDLGNPYIAETFDAVQLAAQERGYVVTLVVARSEEAELQAIERLRGGAADGLILSGGSSRVDAGVRGLVARGVACVVLQDASTDPAVPCVRVDLEEGGAMAARHLIALGHRRIAHITDRRHYAQRPNDRLQGYRRALREAGIAFEPAWLAEADNSFAGGREAMQALMRQAGEPPTAVFVYNDRMAIGALRALRSLGLRVPQDVAVVGFDGIALGEFVDPELTTVEHPHLESGRLAARMLLDMLEGRAPPGNMQTLPMRLVVRRSCGGCAADGLVRGIEPNSPAT